MSDYDDDGDYRHGHHHHHHHNPFNPYGYDDDDDDEMGLSGDDSIYGDGYDEYYDEDIFLRHRGRRHDSLSANFHRNLMMIMHMQQQNFYQPPALPAEPSQLLEASDIEAPKDLT